MLGAESVERWMDPGLQVWEFAGGLVLSPVVTP